MSSPLAISHPHLSSLLTTPLAQVYFYNPPSPHPSPNCHDSRLAFLLPLFLGTQPGKISKDTTFAQHFHHRIGASGKGKGSQLRRMERGMAGWHQRGLNSGRWVYEQIYHTMIRWDQIPVDYAASKRRSATRLVHALFGLAMA